MHKFTPEDLLQYLYKETSPKKTAEIKAALESDWDLQQAFEIIVAGQNQLKKIELSPSDESIKKIMEHAETAVNQVHSH